MLQSSTMTQNVNPNEETNPQNVNLTQTLQITLPTQTTSYTSILSPNPLTSILGITQNPTSSIETYPFQRAGLQRTPQRSSLQSQIQQIPQFADQRQILSDHTYPIQETQSTPTTTQTPPNYITLNHFQSFQRHKDQETAIILQKIAETEQNTNQKIADLTKMIENLTQLQMTQVQQQHQSQPSLDECWSRILGPPTTQTMQQRLQTSTNLQTMPNPRITQQHHTIASHTPIQHQQQPISLALPPMPQHQPVQLQMPSYTIPQPQTTQTTQQPTIQIHQPNQEKNLQTIQHLNATMNKGPILAQ